MTVTIRYKLASYIGIFLQSSVFDMNELLFPGLKPVVYNI